MMEEAADDVECIKLFQDTLPDPNRSRVVLETVWTKVELRFWQDIHREGKIEAVMECLPWDSFRGHAYDSVGSGTTVDWR